MSVDSVSNQNTIQQIIDKTANSKESKRNTGELGKDEFLNLLVTQLQYQDPLKPQDDTQFIAQMAQFSSLEQMQNLNTSYSATKAFGMIGKNVIAKVADDLGKENTITGEATSVKMQSGKAYVVVNGNDVSVDDILEVTEAVDDLNLSNLSDYTGLIGYDCKGCVYDSDSGDIIGVSGIVKEVIRGSNENYAVMDSVEVDVTAVNTDFTSVNPNFIEEYLSNNKGQEVSIVTSHESGQEVTVNAVLNDFNVLDNGRIKAVLDGVRVPVDSIMSIKPAQSNQDTKEDINNKEDIENGNAK